MSTATTARGTARPVRPRTAAGGPTRPTAPVARTAPPRPARAVRPPRPSTGPAPVRGANALAPARGPVETAPRPRMRVVQRPDLTPRRLGFAVTCTALLAAVMLGLLLLNVAISGNAFTLAELHSQQSVVTDQEQALEQRLLVEAAPGPLAARARGLGMLPAAQVQVLGADGSGASPPAPAP